MKASPRQHGFRLLLCAMLAVALPSCQRPVSSTPVFVIVADTLRFDRLVTWAPAVPLGEAVDSLAQDGVVLERVYSSSSWTRTAVATLLTGQDPLTHSVLGRTDVLRAATPGLPLLLQRAGWRTSAWSANPNVLPLWGFGTGFTEFHDIGGMDWAKHKVHAASVFDAVLDDLDHASGNGGFHYIHLMDPHAPYLPADEDLDAVRADPALVASFPGPRDDEAGRDLYLHYLAEIRGMDRALGAFLTGLKSRGLYERSLVVLVADHGEEFLDHGQLYHGKTLYEEVMRIPAILKLPGNRLAGTRVRREAGLADIAPTMLSLLGLPALASADGQSLWEESAGRFRDDAGAQHAILRLDDFNVTALVDGRDKLIVDRKAGNALYDLDADPRERHNLLPGQQAKKQQMQEELDARIARRTAGWHVRVCGNLLPMHIELVVESPDQAVGIDLEDGDRINAPVGGTGPSRAVFEVVPRKAHHEVLTKLVEENVADEDEIALPWSTSALTVRSGSAIPLRFAVGTEQMRRTASVLPFPADGGIARVPASRPVSCWTERDRPTNKPAPRDVDRSPYVRIWFVEPSESVGESSVAPQMQERLRSLGYNW